MATILIVDNSDAQRAQIRTLLEKAQIFESILEAGDGYMGLKMFLAEPVDVVLCDLELPGLDGEKLLHVKEQFPGGSDIPFLFLTGTTDLDRRARLLDGGACDAISKPYHPADLIARLKLHLKVKRLQEELREKNDRLEVLSTVDALTQLKTRRHVFECLHVEFTRARRYGSPLSILMADLDHFKILNDEFGHPGGDAVLRGVAGYLTNQLRATDVPGRYGGEELVIVMQNDIEGAAILGERWRGAIEDAVFPTPDGREARVTVSVGVAQLAWDMHTPEDLVAAADRALYRAKKKGRNRVER